MHDVFLIAHRLAYQEALLKALLVCIENSFLRIHLQAISKMTREWKFQGMDSIFTLEPPGKLDLELSN